MDCSLGDLTLLSMEVSDEDDSFYRIQHGPRTRYISVAQDTFDYTSVLSDPPTLLSSLSPLPPGDWNSMRIYKTNDGAVRKDWCSQGLPSFDCSWHPVTVDLLQLTDVKQINMRLREVCYEDQLAVAKIARFDWEIRYISQESWAYEKL